MGGVIQDLWSDFEEEKERVERGRDTGWHYVILFDPTILCRTLNQPIVGQSGVFEETI